MAANITQSNYNAQQRRGLPGGRADGTAEPGMTWTAVGDINFGRAVSKDSSGDRNCVQGGTKFIGVAQKDPAKDGLELTTALQGGSAVADKFVQYDNVPVGSFGNWFVQIGSDVDPTNLVAYDPATGIFGSHGGLYTALVAGAKFRDTVTLASGEPGVVTLSQPQGNNIIST